MNRLVDRLAARLLLIAVLALARAGAACAGDASPLAIVHVSVIDGTGAATAPDRAVIVERGRISAVGDPARVALPAGAQVIDGHGRYLIPGLWDMHVHVLRGARPEAYFPLLIANGVTGVRDMGGDDGFDHLRELRAQIASGQLIGPRFVAPGPLLDGPYPTLPTISRVVETADDARAAVRDLKSQGADFIKVYNRLPRAAYFAIADESRKLGIVFAGHIPFSVTAQEAAQAGQKSVEHLFNLSFACSSREDELMRLKAQALDGGIAGERRRLRREYLAAVLDSYSPARCQSLFALFARLGTWQTPTLVQRRAFAMPESVSSAHLEYVLASMRPRWNTSEDPRLTSGDDEDRQLQRRYFDADRALIAPMRAAGVRFLVGTDAGDPFAIPGFSLHDELGELVAAGLTPMEALQAATRNAADYLDALGDWGTIEAGRRADLVLLDADPLADIANTRRIAGVVQNGRWLPRAALDELLAQARAAVDRN